MIESTESYRDEVVDLLYDCADQKRLCSEDGLEKCIELAQSAYDLSTKDVDRCQLWKELAAYRLGHLLMWKRDCESVTRAANFFKEAAGRIDRPGIAGPVALIYAAAGLMRSESCSNGSRRSCDALLAEAADWLRSTKFDTVTWHQMDGHLQNQSFNLLELAAYFSGTDIQIVQGQGAVPLKRPERDKAWVIRTSDGNGGRQLISKQLALLELSGFRNRYPDCVTIEMTSGSSFVEAKCKEEKSTLTAAQVKLLFKAIELAGQGKESLVGAMSLRNNDNLFRKLMSRTNQALRTVIPTVNNLIEIPRNGPITINPSVRIAIAAQHSALT